MNSKQFLWLLIVGIVVILLGFGVYRSRTSSWQTSGGDPFMDLDFLVDQIKRVNAVDSTLAKGP